MRSSPRRSESGELRVRQVAQDPSLPSRTIERLQQYHQGVPVWGAEVVRDSEGGVPVSIYGEISAQPAVDTQPGLTADAASQLLLSRAGPGAALLRTTDLVVLRLDTGEHRLAYTSVVSSGNQVHRVFIDARIRCGARASFHDPEAISDRHRARRDRRHEEDVGVASGRHVCAPTIASGRRC